MIHSTRLDSGTVSAVRNDNGILQARVNLSRVGVFPYVYSDGRIVKEAKLPEELFSQSTIESANGAVITDQHPEIKTDSDNGLVNNSNYHALSKGNVYNVKRDSEFLAGMEKIYDASLRQKIESGEQVQVSIGFTADIDWTPGEYNGERYDCIQKNIRINHVAHVDQGRAGEACRVLLDSKQISNYAISQELNQMAIIDNTKQPEKKLTLRVDGKDIQVTSEIMNAVSLLKKSGLAVRKDADPAIDPNAMGSQNPGTPETEAPTTEAMPAESPIDMAKIQEQMKTLDQILNMIQTKFGINFDQLESWMDTREAMIEAYKNQNSGASMDAAVQDALNAVRVADALQIKTDGLSTKQIKIEVIKKHLPTLRGGKFDSMTDAELQIAFSSAVEMSKYKAQNVAKTDSAEIPETRIDELKARVEQAKKNYFSKGVR